MTLKETLKTELHKSFPEHIFVTFVPKLLEHQNVLWLLDLVCQASNR